MKYLPLITLLSLLVVFQFLPAQAPDTLWTKIYGNGWAFSGQQTTDGGYVMTGYGYKDLTLMTYHGLWLIKTDASGDTLWTKTFGGISDYDLGKSIKQTTDGGYIITGYTRSFAAGSQDVWLIKTDGSGDTLWTKTYGNGNIWGYGNSVQQTADGGYIITGVKGSHSIHGEDVWLIKTDTSGDTLWTKAFGVERSWDRGNSVQQTTDGGYIITGNTELCGSNLFDVWLIKTDANGDTLWTKTFGGVEEDRGNSVQQTTDGGYIITGMTFSFGMGGGDIWLIKTDASGDTLWTKTYGSDILSDYGNSVQQTTDGGYIITGEAGLGEWYRRILLIRTNALGDTLWTKGILMGWCGFIGNSVWQTTDGGYFMCGSVSWYGGPTKVFFLKTLPDLTQIDEKNGLITQDFFLYQNYPNPFNPSTTIEFDLPKSSEVTLKVFNILGEEVVTLVSDKLSAGSYSYEWDASNLASGVYLYRLQAGDYVETRKMVLMR